MHTRQRLKAFEGIFRNVEFETDNDMRTGVSRIRANGRLACAVRGRNDGNLDRRFLRVLLVLIHRSQADDADRQLPIRQ